MTEEWTARYWRYMAREEAACDSLSDAVAYLAVGEDDGFLLAVDILAPDGAVALAGRPLFEAMDASLASVKAALSAGYRAT